MSFVYTEISTGGVVNRYVMKEPFSNDHLLDSILIYGKFPPCLETDAVQ